MEQKRSLFGPLVLIAAGSIWLLIQSGTIPSSNLWALTHIWPFLLIAAGIGLILRPFWAYSSILVDILIIGGVVMAIFFAPQMNWDRPSMMVSWNGDGEPFFGPGVRGSGNLTSERRDVEGFDSVRIDYPAQVLISQGNEESLEIEAEDNLLPGLQTEVRGSELRIYYDSEDGEHVNPTKSVTITITVQELNSINFSSAGELIVNGLEANNLDVNLSGAGNVELNDIAVRGLDLNLSGAGSATASGSAEDLNLNISGFGDFNGEDLEGQTANVNISGAGSATVWVEEDLDATISGAGSINYYGSPDNVRKQINGVGGINHVER